MNDFSHLGAAGNARMVDVSAKEVTKRFARARAQVNMSPSTLSAILSQKLPKGDVLAAARIAGISACKRCSDLIPLCHPLPITAAEVGINPISDHQMEILVSCQVDGKTGVEMEALTGACVAALTLYDMCKSIDRGMLIESVCLLEKSGGASGPYTR